jgi:hypothetical protein
VAVSFGRWLRRGRQLVAAWRQWAGFLAGEAMAVLWQLLVSNVCRL